jgi:hypothetical protein
MTISVVTSVKTVGSKKVPPSAERLQPVTILAPFLAASAICASTFSSISEPRSARHSDIWVLWLLDRYLDISVVVKDDERRVTATSRRDLLQIDAWF